MRRADWTDLLDELDRAEAAVRALAEEPMAVLPPSVAPGELIESTWGNAVVGALTDLDTRGVVGMASGVLSGVGTDSVDIPDAIVQWQSALGRHYLVMTEWHLTKPDGLQGNGFLVIATAADIGYASMTHTFVTGASYTSLALHHMLTGDGLILTAKARANTDLGLLDVRAVTIYVLDLG